MSDIEDYLSGDDENSVSSVESEELEVKKPIKKVGLLDASAEEEDLEDEEETEIELEDEDELILDDDEEDLVEEEDDDLEDPEDEDYYDEQEGGAPTKKMEKKTKKNATNITAVKKIPQVPIIMDSDDEDETDENYLQKFDQEINRNYVKNYHPECMIHNYEEVKILTDVVRDSNNIIIDPFHKTIPFLTKYEKARILGQRAKQIESGAKPFVKVPENVIDGYIIAELELRQKRIPFILRRPLPSGGCEYWNLRDLEIII